jgi:RNA polymerase sigma-70 factor, ECF subfamily
MTTLIAFLQEHPNHAFARIMTGKGLAYKSPGAQQQERETPEKDMLSTFNELILQHQDAAYNFAFYLLGDPDSAADATQQAFINAYLHLAQFQGTNFRSWLFKILKNVCIDEIRCEKRRNTYSLDACDEDEHVDWVSFSLAGHVPTPEQMVDQAETSRLIQAALGHLGEPFRTILILVDLQGMDYQEAAQVIDVPIGTVKSRLARARRQLRAVLEQ